MDKQACVTARRTLRDLLPAWAWDALAGHQRRAHRAGEVLLRQGEPGTHVLLLIRGMVKVVRDDIEGRQRLLAFRGPGEVLGEMAVRTGEVRLARVQTMTDCRVSVVPARDFRDFVKQHGLAEELEIHGLHRLREHTECVEGDLDGRLAAALLQLMEISAKQVFSLTRDELAQHLNVGRNSISGALERFGPQCVRTGRTSVEVLDAARLRALRDRRIPRGRSA